MAKKHQIVVDFIIDGKKGKMAIQGLDSAVTKLARNTRTASTRFSEMGNIITGFNSAISIITKLQSTVIGLVDTYKKQEQAEKQLNTALGKNAQGLIDYAASLQAVTTHGDEEIIRAESMLAAYTKDENQIKSLTKATLDFADAMGVDLKTAASLVGKTIGSSTNALARYGIQVEGAVGTTERFESIISSINEKFRGQAEALAQTETGKYTQAMNELGDQMERIGKLLAPVVGGIAEVITTVTKSSLDWLIPMKTNFEQATKAATEQKLKFDELVSTYEKLRLKVNRTAYEQQQYKAAIGELQSLYPNYLRNVNLEKDSYEKVEKAIMRAREELGKYLEYQIKQAILADKKQKIVDSEIEAYEKEEELLKLKREYGKIDEQIAEAQKNRNYAQVTMLQNYKKSMETDIAQKENELANITKKNAELRASFLDLEKRINEKYADVIAKSEAKTTGGEGSGAAKLKSTAPLKVPVELEFPSADEVFADWEDTESEFTNREIERYEELQRRKQEIDELRLETIQDTKERELAYLEMEYQADLERYENVAGAKAVIDQLYAQKKEQIEFQSFLRSSQIINQSIGNFVTLFNRQSETFKALSATQAIISTIAGAAAAVQPPPVGVGPVLGPILAASIVAAGMARVHQIMAQDVPKFATGGIVVGSSHAQGGVVIEAEGGEYIVNRRATQENLELLEAINSGRLYGFSSLKEGFLLLANKIEEQTQRLEAVERVISVSQFDEIYSRYQEEKRMVGLE